MSVDQPSIVLAERAKYESAWAFEAYAAFAPGEQHINLFLDITGAKPGQTVLDAGCGSGKGALSLHRHGFDVHLCDLTSSGLVPEAADLPFTSACLWDDLRPALPYLSGGWVDWVYCCDVLEHIPPAFTMLVVSRLLDICRHGVFLSIALHQDQFGIWVGEPLHQTVQSFADWRDQLNAVGRVKEARDLLAVGIYLIEPRC